MSKLQELIQKLCPNGVEYKKLGEVLEYEQPTKYIVESTDYDNSYNIPVLTAGQTFILGYTNEKFGIYRASLESPTIIFDDFTTSFHWVDFDFKIKSSAIKMLRPQKTFNGSFRYVYYAMKCIKYEAVDHSRHWISKYSQFEIPIPHPDIQEEIVRILDNFTNLAAELQAELQARQEQYEYYRNKLLTFNELNRVGQSVTWMKMSEICEIKRGVRVTRNSLVTDGLFFVFQNSLTPLGNFDKYNRDGNKTFVICAGAAGEIGYSNKPFWAADDCFTIETDKVDNKYIYHFLLTKKTLLKSRVRKASVPRISAVEIGKIVIPIPSWGEQVRIVAILNKFEALTNDISQGLPAEIEARQQQYEYYRDQLLTFKRKEA